MRRNPPCCSRAMRPGPCPGRRRQQTRFSLPRAPLRQCRGDHRQVFGGRLGREGGCIRSANANNRRAQLSTGLGKQIGRGAVLCLTLRRDRLKQGAVQAPPLAKSRLNQRILCRSSCAVDDLVTGGPEMVTNGHAEVHAGKWTITTSQVSASPLRFCYGRIGANAVFRPAGGRGVRLSRLS